MAAATPENTLDNADALRDHFGEPLPVSIALMLDYLHEQHCRLIERSPFICIATADASGQPMVSPKGDGPGFVKVLDKHTLFVPDRPGNNKVMGLSNLVRNPKLSIIFMIPGYNETLRVEGTAKIVLDSDLLALGDINGNLPPAGLLVTVTRAYAHCGKAMIRSHVWDPERRVQRGELPTLAEMIKVQAQMEGSVDEVQSLVDHEYKTNLY